MSDVALSREQRKEETRRALIDAAAHLFATKGVEASSLDDIARRVGLTKGAIYANFPSKQALIEAVADERSTVLDLEAVDAGSVITWIVKLVTSVPDESVMLDLEWLLLHLRGQLAPESTEWPADQQHRLEEVFGGLAGRVGIEVAELASVLQAFGRGVAQELARSPGCISEGTVERLLRRWLGDGASGA